MSGGGIITRLAESSSVSNEELKKKRFSSRAVGETGSARPALLGERVVGLGRPDRDRARRARLGLVRRRPAPRRWPARRGTSPESSAGVSRRARVRRFRGSSRVLIRLDRNSKPGWLGGRSPATRVPACERPQYPTLSHNATQMAPLPPQSAHPLPQRGQIPHHHGRFGCGTGWGRRKRPGAARTRAVAAFWRAGLHFGGGSVRGVCCDVGGAEAGCRGCSGAARSTARGCGYAVMPA